MRRVPMELEKFSVSRASCPCFCVENTGETPVIRINSQARCGPYGTVQWSCIYNVGWVYSPTIFLAHCVEAVGEYTHPTHLSTSQTDRTAFARSVRGVCSIQ